MPTQHYGKVKHLLRDGLAVVIRREPFTIQLRYDSKQFTQSVTLGVKTGAETAALSASTERKELFSAEVLLRSDITKLLIARQEARRTRRSRKTRYRQTRFNNRRRPENWLAPSVEQKVQSHLSLIKKVNAILPITETVIQVAAYDTQKIQHPGIKGEEYQQGPLLDFWNVREYVLHRDGHKCLNCKGKSEDKVLNVHHIVPRSEGGSDSPSNLITLCETCHHKHHREGMEIKAKPSFRSLQKEAVMSIMRWEVYNRAKASYENVHLTYGYKTKCVRIENGLEKSHRTDALCIAEHPKALPCIELWQMRQRRRHNRQIHKANLLSGGRKKLNQAPYLVKGFRLFDKVKYNGIECFVFGRRASGSFDIRLIDGTKVHAGINCKKLKFLSASRSYLQTLKKRNGAIPPPTEVGSILAHFS